MRRAGVEGLLPEDATYQEKELWMTQLLREIRLNEEGKWKKK